MTDAATKTSPGFRVLIPIHRTFAADLETPVSVFLKLRPLGARYLLESVESGTNLGRYSFIGMDPWMEYLLTPQGSRFAGDAVKEYAFNPGDPLNTLRSWTAGYAVAPWEDGPRIPAGPVGYLSYDLSRLFDRVRSERTLPDHASLARFVACQTHIVVDHVRRSMSIVVLSLPGEEDEARGRISEVWSKLREPWAPDLETPFTNRAPLRENVDQAAHEEAVRNALEHIARGDIFQVVLSRRVTGETGAGAFQVYRALRMVNPSPYLFYLELGDEALIGSSPETLVRLELGRAVVNPIAGTLPRGETFDEDQEMERRLRASEKDRAEHVMLVDLGRNDLGRVCKPGTVRVTRQMEVERFSHVMHLVSQVEGELRYGLNAFDLIQACFPAGTVSGAPKIRAMEIIDRLEPDFRGIYAGAVGYFGFLGDMDFCIAIRTIQMIGGTFVIQAGGGIVADSDPTLEFLETQHKARALHEAIRVAEAAES